MQHRHDARQLIRVIHHAGQSHREGPRLPVDFQLIFRRAAVGAGGRLPHVRDIRRQPGRPLAQQLRHGPARPPFQIKAEHVGRRGIRQQ